MLIITNKKMQKTIKRDAKIIIIIINKINKHAKVKAFGDITTTAIDQQKGFMHEKAREAPYHTKQCHGFFTALRIMRFTF